MVEGVNRGDAECGCQTGNLFLCEMTPQLQGQLSMRGIVNGSPTEILPVGEVFEHPNDLPGTANALEITGAGMAPTVFLQDVTAGNLAAPNQLKTFIGACEVPAEQPDPVRQALRDMIASPATPDTMRMQYETRLEQLDEEDAWRANDGFEEAGGKGEGIYTLALTIAQLADGEVNIDTLIPEQIYALAEDLGPVFNINWESLASVRTSLGGRVLQSAIGFMPRLETTFRSIGGDRLNTLTRGQRMLLRLTFIKELMVTRVGRVSTINGRKVITFRGYAGLRAFMNATYYPASSIAVMNAGIVARDGTALRSAAGSPFKGASGIFLVIGGVVNVLAWLETDGERFLSDLFIDLGVMVAVAIVSSMVAAAVMMGVVAAAALAGLALPAIVIGVGAAAIGIAVSMGISLLFDRTGVVEDLKAKARRFLEIPQVFYEPGWHPIETMGLAEGIDYINNAPVEEQEYILERMFGG